MPQKNIEELKYQIALTMAPSIGPITARKLIEKIGSARAVFNQTTGSLQKIEGIGPFLSRALNTPGLLSKAETEIRFLEKHRIEALYFKDPDYPALLTECEDAPIILYSRGAQGLYSKRSLSVVGTRKATSYGRNLCREIIKSLSELTPKPTIISGLAYGIDVIAHRAALEYGLPTVAVLGHGMDTIYPFSHRETAVKISKQGALVTDFHSGMGPERNNFLRRNRIIAGLSQGTLVVESAKTGGSLITANMAFSYHRPVMAVPGRVGDNRSSGCNRLITREIAAITESAEDIIRYLNWDVPLATKKIIAPEIITSDQEMRLLHSMQSNMGNTPDSLSQLTGIPVHMVLVTLLEMELKEWISVEPGNRYKMKISLE
ncbi:MAG: DNA-protecting protein DprA [Bacteroidetes bacterium]|nr:MAG: DNA-protecting protein DprA [Bacteroidota bacterium]